MFQGQSILCVILARGGSKGLPGKNIRPFCNKPLIAWSIESGLKSLYVDEVLVSTDDPDIAQISKDYGAKVPWLRPKELSQDHSTSVDALLHVLSLSSSYDLILLLQPTSPLRDEKDIDAAINYLLEHPKAESLISVTEAKNFHPKLLVTMNHEKQIVPFDSSYGSQRRQDFSHCYYFQGALYLSWVSAFLERKSFFHEKTIGFLFPKERSLDIDDLFDFEMGEWLQKKRLGDRL